MKRFRVLKDIVIKKGTILYTSPSITKRVGDCHFSHVIGLSNNTSGYFEYCIDEKEELFEYFEEI